jgi:hypothetical protein
VLGTEIVDRCLGKLQVVPGGFDDVGEALAVLTRLAHEFEKQEIKKPRLRRR